MAQGGSSDHACARCGKTHPSKCCDSKTGYFKCVQEGHFMKECLKNKKGSGNTSIEPNLHQFLNQTRLHLEELLLVLANEQTAFMQLQVIKSKQTLQMLSLV